MKHNVIFLFPFLLALIACQKEDFTIINLNNNEISIYGHGGMGVGDTYPINSFESLYCCLKIGADGTEIDVQMTQDSVLVAYHAMELEYSTNGFGQIINKTWNEISNLTYNNPPYTNYKIISLDELFTNIDNIKDFKFTFDCKLYNSTTDYMSYCISFVNAIHNFSMKYDLVDNLYVESQNPLFLGLLHERNADYKLFIYPESFESGMKIAMDMKLHGITISMDNISKEQIELAHLNNLFVAIWNIHSKNENIEAINKNPDIIQADKIEHLVKLLKK